MFNEYGGTIQNVSDPVVDLLSSLLEAQWVIRLRSVEVSAVATSNAVAHP